WPRSVFGCAVRGLRLEPASPRSRPGVCLLRRFGSRLGRLYYGGSQFLARGLRGDLALHSSRPLRHPTRGLAFWRALRPGGANGRRFVAVSVLSWPQLAENLAARRACATPH